MQELEQSIPQQEVKANAKLENGCEGSKHFEPVDPIVYSMPTRERSSSP